MQRIEISPEQRMLQDIAASYMGDKYSFSERSRIAASDAGFDAGHWRAFAEMGWLGLPFPENLGGSGGSMLDLLLLMESFGRALVVEPYLSTVVLGGLTLLRSGTAEQRQSTIPAIARGALQVALAFTEPQAGYESCNVETTATPDGDGFRLRGRKGIVLGAASAGLLIVSARTSGSSRDRAGISLFLVKPDRPGVSMRPYPTLDGRRAAEVYLDDVVVGPGDLLGQRGGGAAPLEEAALMGSVALLGEAVGCLEAAVTCTAAHLNGREQFGRKLASFQALRHRVADMAVMKEEVRALALLAAQTFQSSCQPDGREAIAAAKAYAGMIGLKLCEEAIQLHGAIGIADEYVVGHFLKRMIVIDRMFGDAEHHLTAYLDGRDHFSEYDSAARRG